MRRQYQSRIYIEELIRKKRQKNNENFHASYEPIFELVDQLNENLLKYNFLEILRTSSYNMVQHEILNLEVYSVLYSRDSGRKRENFTRSIQKGDTFVRHDQHKRIAEFSRMDIEMKVENMERIDNEVLQFKLKCWNSQEVGHSYQNCLAERKISCYGCAKANIYKPNGSNCNKSKNAMVRAQRSAFKPIPMK